MLREFPNLRNSQIRADEVSPKEGAERCPNWRQVTRKAPIPLCGQTVRTDEQAVFYFLLARR